MPAREDGEGQRRGGADGESCEWRELVHVCCGHTATRVAAVSDVQKLCTWCRVGHTGALELLEEREHAANVTVLAHFVHLAQVGAKVCLPRTGAARAVTCAWQAASTEAVCNSQASEVAAYDQSRRARLPCRNRSNLVLAHCVGQRLPPDILLLRMVGPSHERLPVRPLNTEETPDQGPSVLERVGRSPVRPRQIRACKG